MQQHHPKMARAMARSHHHTQLPAPMTRLPLVAAGAARSRTRTAPIASSSSGGSNGQQQKQQLQQPQQPQQPLQPPGLGQAGAYGYGYGAGAAALPMPPPPMWQQRGLLSGSSTSASGSASASGDSEWLWAGYSDLSEQLRRLQQAHDSALSRLQELGGRLEAMQQAQQLQQQAQSSGGAGAAGAWQAASLLLFAMLFINLAGVVLQFNAGLFLPWALTKTPHALWVRELVSTWVPITNSAVVLCFCVAAVKAAIRCLRW